MSTALDAKKQIQTILAVKADGEIGQRTLAALNRLVGTPDAAEWPPAVIVPPDAGWHAVKASSFADPADVSAFRRCKANGGSDQECFKVGDNGIGKWGDDCTEGSGPSCALPPEDWQPFGAAARKKLVVVRCNGRDVVCELRDTMPHKANITNGAGLDLNPDAVAALGLHPPIMVAAEWEWA